MTSLEELLLLIPTTITTNIKVGCFSVDEIQRSEKEITYHLLIAKRDRESYINSIKRPNESIHDYYDLDGDQNGDIWVVSYVDYGWEGIENRLPIRKRYYKQLLTTQEFEEEHEENDISTYFTGAVGGSLEEVLERVYNWLKAEEYVV